MACPTWIDARFRVHVLLWGVLSALAYGLVAAIIPNPVFGRQIPPESFAIAVWLLSAPLVGVIGATYSSPRSAATSPLVLLGVGSADGSDASLDDARGTWLGGVASFGTFLAIGCPVCNKVVVLALGYSGAMRWFAPLQPLLQVAGIAVLAWALIARLRSSVACPRPLTGPNF